MSAESVIGAVIAHWPSVTTSGYPSSLWFDGVPMKDASGNVSLPTVELIDSGTTVEYEMEEHPVETTTLTFVVRATTLTEADSIVKRIKYGGGTLSAGSGYDFCTSLGFTSAIRLFCNGMQRTSEKRSREAPRDPNAAPVWRIDVGYTVTTIRTGV